MQGKAKPTPLVSYQGYHHLHTKDTTIFMLTAAMFQLLQVLPLMHNSHEFMVMILCKLSKKTILIKKNTCSSRIHTNVIGVVGKCVVELVSSAFWFEREDMEELHYVKCGCRFGVHQRYWVQRWLKELDLCWLGSLTAAIVECNFVYPIAVDNDEVVVW